MTPPPFHCPAGSPRSRPVGWGLAGAAGMAGVAGVVAQRSPQTPVDAYWTELNLTRYLVSMGGAIGELTAGRMVFPEMTVV